MSIVVKFWNLSPRDEFGGKSPQQKEEEELMGPREKELIEGTGIFTIEEFWIPPVGKILINRLVEYFVQKGRISK